MTLDADAIVELVKQYEKESRAIKEEALRNCWYMRGGITYNEAMDMGAEERKLISDLVKENLKIAKESGMPFF